MLPKSNSTVVVPTISKFSPVAVLAVITCENNSNGFLTNLLIKLNNSKLKIVMPEPESITISVSKFSTLALRVTH